MFVDIDKDENIEYTMQVAHRRAEAARYEAEGKELLGRLGNQRQELSFVADDEAVDDNIRVVGRKTVQLEARMREMRQNLRNSIRSTGQDLKMSDDEAALVLQRTFKGYRIRRLISLLFVERFVRVWDEALGRGDTHTHPNIHTLSNTSCPCPLRSLNAKLLSFTLQGFVSLHRFFS